jgi:hypothetical protein
MEDSLPTPYVSKYKIEDIKDGFRITAPDRHPTNVTTDGYVFYVLNDGDYDKTRWATGLFELRSLISKITNHLMMYWKPKTQEELGRKTPTGAITKWAKNKTGRALAKRIKAKWQDMLLKCDPQVVAVQRSYFSATAKFCGNLIHPGFYQIDKYILSDIINYRAAAMAVGHMQFDYNAKKFDGWYTERVVEDITDSMEWQPRRRLGTIVNNWMEVYGKPNGPLRKTLMNMPGGIPFNLAKRLAMMNLDKPLTTRPELLAYVSIFEGARDVHYRRNAQVLCRSSTEQIRHAVNMVAKHLREPISINRKAFGFINNMQYIWDYPDNHNGSLPGLAEKSIRWHREHRYLENRKYCKYDESHKVALPPIELPINDKIKFLSTVGEIFAEGDNMSHCVSGYTNNAVNGHCYLFHADYAGEQATVEVSPYTGRVAQARGPHNSTNKATKWATQVLNKWAAKLGKQEVENLEADLLPF